MLAVILVSSASLFFRSLVSILSQLMSGYGKIIYRCEWGGQEERSNGGEIDRA